MTKSFFSGFNPQGKLNNADKRMHYVDIAYFFGIILVVLGHSHPLDDSWVQTGFRTVQEIIYTFHMPLYFFIGGYLLVHSKSIDDQSYFTWAKSKIVKFLIPYLVLTVIAYVPKAMLGDTTDQVELSLRYFLETTFITPRVGVWGHFWFIAAFLPLELIWGLWRKYSKKYVWVYRIGLLIGVSISLTLAIFPIRTNVFTLLDISQQAMFYAVGILTALIKPVLWNNNCKNIVWIVICAIINYFLYPYGNCISGISPIMCFLVGMILVWLFWNLSVLLQNIKKFTLPQTLSKYTFNIYIYSWPAQAALDSLLRGIGLNWIAILITLFISGFVFPILIVNIYKKARFLHCKFFDLLIGVQTVK